jgi:hypothetical protein
MHLPAIFFMEKLRTTLSAKLQAQWRWMAAQFSQIQVILVLFLGIPPRPSVLQKIRGKKPAFGLRRTAIF